MQDGRYAQEVAAVARLLIQEEASAPIAQVGEAHYLLARVHEMLGKDVDAIVEYRLAIPMVKDSQTRQDEIFERARACAKRLIAEPRWMELLEADIASALTVRQGDTDAVDGDDATVVDPAEAAHDEP